MRDGSLRSAMRLASLCLAWYVISAGNNVVGKVLLSAFPFPMSVTIVQLLSISLYTGPALTIFGSRRMPTIEWPYYLKLIVPLAFGKFFASVSTHVSIWKVPVSYAHTVKASMPLFVVILSRIIFGEKQTTKVYLSLFPIIIGVAIATVTELEFHPLGLFSALFATFVFALQNMFSKKVLQETSIHHLRLLHLLARLALILFTPVWLWHDVRDIIYQDSSTNMDNWLVAFLLFLDGLANFLQNVIAFTVLSLVTTLTYSVCNASKRIAVIFFSLIMLKNPVTSLNIFGMALAIFGVFYYNKAKHDAKYEKKPPLLPYTKSDSNLLLKFDQVPSHNIRFHNVPVIEQNGTPFHYNKFSRSYQI